MRNHENNEKGYLKTSPKLFNLECQLRNFNAGNEGMAILYKGILYR